MKTITVTGVSITDDIHQLDPRITGGDATAWNVTRMMRDALDGRFGPPIKRKLSVIPAMTAAEMVNIGWERVVAIKAKALVLGLPILMLEYKGARRIVDGNHRITARKLACLDDFECYMVPEAMEGDYRVRCFEDGKEVPLPFD